LPFTGKYYFSENLKVKIGEGRRVGRSNFIDAYLSFFLSIKL
jgi:hypothetical protein